MDNLQFDLGDEWFSMRYMMLNDLDTNVFGEENELGDDSPSFCLWAYFHNQDATCEILGNQ